MIAILYEYLIICKNNDKKDSKNITKWNRYFKIIVSSNKYTQVSNSYSSNKKDISRVNKV